MKIVPNQSIGRLSQLEREYGRYYPLVENCILQKTIPLLFQKTSNSYLDYNTLMPELPEVETVRRVLESKILHKTITRVEVLNKNTFSGNPDQITGQEIISFSRIGKQLSIHLKNGLILHFHLKMTGQLIFQDDHRQVMGHPTKDMLTQELPNKSTRVVFYFSDSSILYFNDQRKFGWVKIFNQVQLDDFQKELGADILDPSFTLAYFASQLNSHRAIKLVLLDQARFAGIGNIYANDALFIAQIHPSIPANSLTSPQIKKLHSSVIEIITESLSHGGSTAKDNKYVRPDGSFGSHQYHFRVYQRTGEPCLVCHTPIINIKVGGRGTFYCPKCQK